ncbi:MAG: hypothetical protein Q4Q06_03690 [Bacteroidota bacterium]|nr:hypothetical protein [Bacteroidota bacterium]
MKIRNIISIFVGLIFVSSIQAQQEETYNENVTINVAFDPIINDANKINSDLPIFDTSFIKTNFTFDHIDRGYNTTLRFDTIKAANVKGEPQTKLYHINLKGGLGLGFGKDLKIGFLPLLQGSYTSLRNRSLMYGVDVYSKSNLTGEKNYGHSAYSNKNINLYAKKIFKHYVASSQIYYNYSRNYYYGDERYPQLSIDKGDYRISWHDIAGDIAYSTLNRGNIWQHNGRVKLNYTGNNRSNGEFVISALLDVNRNLEVFSKAYSQRVGVSLDYKQAFYGDTRLLMNLSPYFIFDWTKFHFYASLGIMPGVHTYKSFQLLPTATVSFEIIEKILSLYGGLKSESTMPTLSSLSKENPFLQPIPNLEDGRENTFFAKGFLNITPKSQISLEAGYKIMTNQYFYMNSDILKKKIFNIHRLVYDDAKKYYLSLESYFNITNDFSFNLKATLQRTNRENSDFEAWYTPGFTLSSKINYTWNNKLYLSLTPTYYSKCKAYIESLQKEKDIKSMLDISLSARYEYDERWSFFADLNNLAFQQYYLYYNYPSQTFNFLLGCIYRL